MWAARITLPHFSVSAAMNLPKSAGVPVSAVRPRSAKRALMPGLAKPALISLLSFSMISAGSFGHLLRAHPEQLAGGEPQRPCGGGVYGGDEFCPVLPRGLSPPPP